MLVENCYSLIMISSHNKNLTKGRYKQGRQVCVCRVVETEIKSPGNVAKRGGHGPHSDSLHSRTWGWINIKVINKTDEKPKIKLQEERACWWCQRYLGGRDLGKPR